MRENILANGSQSVENAGSDLKRKFEEQIANLLREMEAKLNALNAAAAEQETRALQQMPALAA